MTTDIQQYRVEPWVQHATCRQIGLEAFFPEKGEPWQEAVSICQFRCTVRLQCLDYAMRTEQGNGYKERFGVFGGMTPLKRKKYEPEWLAEQEESSAA